LAVVWLFCLGASASAQWSRTYTTDADFDEGVLFGVEHETVHDQLQLSQHPEPFPFIWVPNQEGTVSKVNTDTGREIARYRVGPPGLPLGGNPSRTTVDLQGACWVGNRQAGTVVKIGLLEAGQFIDRNGNGVCDTSRDLNDDGDITGGELLAWGQDECVLYEVVLVPGWEGAYVPGAYPGPYDTDYWGVGPRGLAIDPENNIWVGTWSTQKFFHLDTTDGSIMSVLDMAPYGCSSYGAVIDSNRVMWSSAGNAGNSARIDLKTDPPTVTTWNPGHYTYGIGLDYLGHLFASGWTSSGFSRINIVTAVKDWTLFDGRLYTGRGVVATEDNNMWVASSNNNAVVRLDNDGNVLANIPVGSQPTGVAVDAEGKVWVCDLGDESIHRIDPLTNTIDLSKALLGSAGHYSYSDMTGVISRTITTNFGTWTVVRDSGAAGTLWGTVSWTSSEPPETSLSVKARSSDDQLTWSAWETADNGVMLSATPPGQFLQVQVTLQRPAGLESPVLYDLTITQAIIPVFVDIKPGSWPNPVNCGSKGVIPIAICGTETFDVTTIDPETILVGREGYAGTVSPIRCNIDDVATPFVGPPGGGHDLNGDGFPDLVFHIRTQDLVDAVQLTDSGGKVIPLIITGNLFDAAGGTPIIGTDYVRIVKPKGSK
jgi:streptogramin lyase